MLKWIGGFVLNTNPNRKIVPPCIYLLMHLENCPLIVQVQILSGVGSLCDENQYTQTVQSLFLYYSGLVVGRTAGTRGPPRPTVWAASFPLS